MDTREGPIQAPRGLRQIRLEANRLGVTNLNFGVGDGQQAGVSKDVSMFSEDVSVEAGPDKVPKEDSPLLSQKEDIYRDEFNEMAENPVLTRAKRSGSGLAEFAERRGTGGARVDGETSDERRSPGPLLDGQRQGKSEFKWNRDEGRGNSPREEPKLTSSTFALTGDSAHNHAVVYWSGQNSSVSKTNTCIL